MTVSGNPPARPLTRDRQRKMNTTQSKPVRLASISYPEPGVASCNCGWEAAHHRLKVLEDKIDRHLSKKHGGLGIRLP